MAREALQLQVAEGVKGFKDMGPGGFKPGDGQAGIVEGWSWFTCLRRLPPHLGEKHYTRLRIYENSKKYPEAIFLHKKKRPVGHGELIF